MLSLYFRLKAMPDYHFCKNTVFMAYRNVFGGIFRYEVMIKSMKIIIF